uniref:Transposase n=1 Tax=Mesocestoides corti TaxID=53468 RepID=A0A5K3FF67_MESCO
MNDVSFLQVYKSKVPRQLFAWATILPDVGGMTDGSHIGDGSQHGVEATSRDRWCDFRMRLGVRALNDAPVAESQSAHEFPVSIVATRNGPTGEQEE